MRLSLCGDPAGQYTKTDGDVLLEWVRVILDGNGRCILTVQYSPHPSAEAEVYLYVSQDPALISALEAFAAVHTA